jgi:signal transduction histidine kinase
VSRSLRIVVLLALFGWTLSGVPERVQAQRTAVADLAAGRGAASAGGALLARMGDLRAADTAGPDLWRVVAGQDCAAAGAPAAGYAAAVATVRARQACRAARDADPAIDAAQVVTVDGATFLVLPGEAAVVDPVVVAPAVTDAAVTDAVDAAVSDAVDAPVSVGLRRDGLTPDNEARLRAVLSGLGNLGVVDDAVVAEILDAIARPPVPDAPVLAAATVAWWPPIQAEIEARTGIPLQVGGEPPRARAILPGHRLAGTPVWSLPTPATEATIDLFDGGTLLWLLLLTGGLGTELVVWRRAVVRERDRQGARDAILQRLSHELRTPAASVRSLVDALDLPGTTDAERQQFRDLVRSEAERLAVGIDRLLQAARGDTRVRIDPVPLDLHAWADAVRARWAPRLPGLVVEGVRPSPATADPERLDEAVDALLDNALKYGGPTVTLAVAPGRVSVSDDGEGVPAKDRARILEKFERVEGRANDPGGHGLGLWAVAEVARAHGGKLTLEGKNRFVVTVGHP